MKIALTFKDVSTQACHVGLGVTALNLAASLNDAGISVETWPVFDGYALEKRLTTRQDITHVVMLAPWVDTPFLRGLTSRHPNVQFTITCHSNVGFLQCDGWSIKVIREQMELERDRLNFHISGNSRAYCDFITAAYRRPCQFLPNLHHVQMKPQPKKRWSPGNVLRIGAFGATRVLKNLGTAVGGALVVAETLQTETEIWVSAGREEGGRNVMAACRALVHNHPFATLVESQWQTWPQFQNTIRKMNILFQPSFTESFNNVTADGVAMGVPSIVGPAIDWVPDAWKTDPDDAVQVGKAAIALLGSRWAPQAGYKALCAYNKRGLSAWKSYLLRVNLTNPNSHLV